jgi:hypothetical protein
MGGTGVESELEPHPIRASAPSAAAARRSIVRRVAED